MNNNNFNKILSIYEEACLIYVNEYGKDYLEALIKVTDYITGVDEISNERITDIVNKINQFDDLEIVQSVFSLLMIDGLKSAGLKVDMILPQTVSYLMGYIIGELYKDQFNLKVLDPSLQSGNLLFTIAKFLVDKELELFGVENDQRLVELANSYFNLGLNDIIIYFQDKMMQLNEQVDVVVGNLDDIDIPTYYSSHLHDQGVRYGPFLLLENKLKNLKEDCYFLCIINNDFFQEKDFGLFKNIIEQEYTLKGLMILPNEMFKAGHVGKSILIGQRKVIPNHSMALVNLPNMVEQDELLQAVEIINEFINEILEEEI